MSAQEPEARLPSMGSGHRALPACCTTGRYRAGHVRHGQRLAARLARDAAALGLGVVDQGTCLADLRELGRRAFGADGQGIVRLEAGLDDVGVLRISGQAIPLVDDPPAWEAVVGRVSHPGPGHAPGAKRTSLPALEAARRQVREAGVSEALLFDRASRLVEGARTNVVVLCRDGSLRTPPVARGGVAGVARAILLERVPELAEGDVSREELEGARAVVAVNAVRGARCILSLDGRAVGGMDGARLAERLGSVLDREG